MASLAERASDPRFQKPFDPPIVQHARSKSRTSLSMMNTRMPITIRSGSRSCSRRAGEGYLSGGNRKTEEKAEEGAESRTAAKASRVNLGPATPVVSTVSTTQNPLGTAPTHKRLNLISPGRRSQGSPPVDGRQPAARPPAGVSKNLGGPRLEPGKTPLTRLAELHSRGSGQ